MPAQNGENARATVRDVAGDAACIHMELFGTPYEAGMVVRINDFAARLDDEIRQNDCVELRQVRTIGELIAAENLAVQTEDLLLDGEPCGPDDALHEGARVTLAAAPAPPPEIQGKTVVIRLNGRRVALPPRPDGQSYQLFDLLNFVTDIDLGKPEGKAVLKRNREEVSFLESIADGDEVQIYWEK